MAKNLFNDFTWFDKKSRPLYSPSNAGEPSLVGYEQGHIGGLSALGRALSGIAAPFAVDFQYGQRQYEADLKQQQADMEFAALLEKNRLTNQAILSKEKSRSEFLSKMGDMEAKGYNAIPYMTADGGAGVRWQQDPEYQASLKVRNAAQKTINQEIPTFNQTLSALDRMDELIDKSPDYKPGILPATIAKSEVALKKLANDPFTIKYQGFIDQSLSNLSRKLGEKGVLTEPDIVRVLNGLGRMDMPKEVRKQLTAEIRQKMADSGVGLLETAGMSKEGFAKKYPDTAKKLFNIENKSVDVNNIPKYDPNTQRLQRNKLTGEYRVVPK